MQHISGAGPRLMSKTGELLLHRRAEPSARFLGDANTASRLQYRALPPAELESLVNAGRRATGDSPIFCLSLLSRVTHMCITQMRLINTAFACVCHCNSGRRAERTPLKLVDKFNTK